MDMMVNPDTYSWKKSGTSWDLPRTIDRRVCIFIIIFAGHGVGGNLNVPLSQRQGTEYTAMDAMKASFDLEPLLMLENTIPKES